MGQLGNITILQRVLILRGRHAPTHLDVLADLHEKHGSLDAGGIALQTADDFRGVRRSLIVRLEIDVDASPGSSSDWRRSSS